MISCAKERSAINIIGGKIKYIIPLGIVFFLVCNKVKLSGGDAQNNLFDIFFRCCCVPGDNSILRLNNRFSSEILQRNLHFELKISKITGLLVIFGSFLLTILIYSSRGFLQL